MPAPTNESKERARHWLAEQIKKSTNLTSEQADRKATEIARTAEREQREKKGG